MRGPLGAADYRTAAGRGETPFLPERGTRAAAWTTLVLLAAGLVRIPTFGMIETFDRYTGARPWEWSIRYLCEFHGDIRTSTLFEGSVYSTTFLAFGVAAFLLWSRAWRLFRHHGTQLARRRGTTR